jgi:glycine dehydrogenase
MSFPVAGTLMIEPTESEDKTEVDRFCDAMFAIRVEIRKVGAGEFPAGDNPLARAPHTAEDVVATGWTRAYSREDGAFPGDVNPATKYWPPVSRIDSAYGDRNVMCSCPPLDGYGS